jgi:hypothetical protein
MCAHESVELVTQAIIARAGLVEKDSPFFARARDGRLK